jgi:hypothetical protein
LLKNGSIKKLFRSGPLAVNLRRTICWTMKAIQESLKKTGLRLLHRSAKEAV